MNLAWLGVIIPVAIAAGAALGPYLTSRRTSRGRVSTSDADALWQQSQAMMASLQSRLERAEDQRDKLIDLQDKSIGPALEAIARSQQHVVGMLTEMAAHLGK